MNHHQRKVLQAIFGRAKSAGLISRRRRSVNQAGVRLDRGDVVSVLNGLGAEIDTRTKSRIA